MAQLISDRRLPWRRGISSSGLGIITSSSFWVPQVNMPGSMATFVQPAGIPAPVLVPAPTVVAKGLGLITSSSFFVPQVNVPGSMATFVTPTMAGSTGRDGTTSGLGLISSNGYPYGTIVPAATPPVPSTNNLGNWLPVLLIGGLLLAQLTA
jgi:hypothetical protein